MKLLIFSLFFFGFLLGAQAAPNSFAQPRSCDKASILGDFDHFPWSLAKPFPWNDIQGTWVADDNGAPMYFTFRIVRTAATVRQLVVVQYRDLKSCDIVAKGVGRQSYNQVRAQLVSRQGEVFRMSLASFHASDLPVGMRCGPEMMGMSLFTKEDIQYGTEEELIETPVFKVSASSVCQTVGR